MTTTPLAPERRGGAPPARRGGPALTARTTSGLLAKILLLGLVAAVALWLAFPLVDGRRWGLLALLVLTTAGLFALYLQPRAVPLKYLVPGTLLLVAFQVLPVAWTVSTAFTNFGDGHRGTKEEAVAAVERSSVRQVAGSAAFALTVAVRGDDPDGPLVLLLVDPSTGAVQAGDAAGLEPVPDATVGPTGRVTAAPGYAVLGLAAANARAGELRDLAVPTQRGAIAAQGLSRAFEGLATIRYDAACDCMRQTDGPGRWDADDRTGRFVSSSGAALPQGWQVGVGLANFSRLVTDPAVRDHFTGVLVWNVVFAVAVVAGTFVLGLGMAVTLNSPRVRGLRTFRALIVLPYAMPAFAMMLVWRDLFNADFGLVNAVTGLDVNWLGEPWTARLAVVVVQLWLGYPYMFLVCTGALQSIPADLTEAAWMDGASRWQAFRSVVLPLLLVAVAPLLIASFAFNFNNYNAIAFTTDGGPFPADSPQAGATDLLISYTYRLAFGASGAEYGFAAAVSVVIFLIVAAISVAGFRRTAALEEINRGG